MSYPCADCTIDTVPLGGNREYYEVYDELWARAGAPGIGQSDNGPDGFFLCVGCLETRLGRKLNRGDFKPLPANEANPWYSERLNDRLGGPGWGADKDKVPQYHPKGLYLVADYVCASGQLTYPRDVQSGA